MDSTNIIRRLAGVSVVAAMVSGCGTTSPGPVATSEPPTAPKDAASADGAREAALNTPSADSSQWGNPASTRGPDLMVGTTTNIRRVTFAEEGADFDPSVSADGSKLVFASTQHRPTSDIYIKRTDSRVVTRLTTDPAEDAMPALSPDGSRIAFASNRAGNWDIYVMSVTGGKAVQLTSDSSDEIQPSWSPDGTQLVYSRMGAGSGRWELWVATVQNPATANFIGYGMHPRWCPAAGTGEGGADKILYQLGRDRGRRSFSVWTLDYANGNAANTTEIAGSAAAALINPTWSPDGQWVAYAEVNGENLVPGARPTSASLWMVSVGGDAKVRLTTDAAASFSPVWASSNRVYFTSNMGGVENVWSLDATQAVAAATATLNGAATAQTPATTEPTQEAVAAAPESEGGTHR